MNLPSRTTLIAEAHVGAKDYQGGMMIAEAPVALPQYSSSTAIHGGKGAGMGMGGPSIRWSVPATERTPGAVSGQVTVLARLAQSLADRTAVSVQYTHRSTFGGLPTAIVTTPALFFEDGIYDDPFASGANTARGSVKHVRPGGVELELQGAWMGKDFRGARALDLEGSVLASNELRSDRIWRAGAGVTIPLCRAAPVPWPCQSMATTGSPATARTIFSTTTARTA
ncbi:MAG: hypothetical protein EHM13_13265 [Acidobacteria bacterium]|nr:MAG: hypothetical protein EHM13_13265 [Acidobacteriota bacterium]